MSLAEAHPQSKNERAFWNQEEKFLQAVSLQCHLQKNLLLPQMAKGRGLEGSTPVIIKHGREGWIWTKEIYS